MKRSILSTFCNFHCIRYILLNFSLAKAYVERVYKWRQLIPLPQLTQELKLWHNTNVTCSKAATILSFFQPVCCLWVRRMASRTWTPTSSRRRGSSSCGRTRRSTLRARLRIRSQFVGPSRQQNWSELPDIANKRNQHLNIISKSNNLNQQRSAFSGSRFN